MRNIKIGPLFPGMWIQKLESITTLTWQISLPIEPEGPGRVQRQWGAILDVVGDVFQLSLVDVDVVFRRVHWAALSRRVQLQVWGCRNRHFLLYWSLSICDCVAGRSILISTCKNGRLLMLTHLPFGRLDLPRHRHNNNRRPTEEAEVRHSSLWLNRTSK